MERKVVYVCNKCGYKISKWMGKCTSCGAFNTMEETVVNPAPTGVNVLAPNTARNRSVKLDELSTPDYIRVGSGMSEFDRVLGGGLVEGSAVLISGEPGIGK